MGINGYLCIFMRLTHIAIQGVEGCFHDAAAREFFKEKEIEVVPCDTFPALVSSVCRDSSLLGIMAIENTIAGSLLQNHELINANGLRVVGEYKKRIEHSLAALPGQTVADITEVHSHPMALMQCEEYLMRHPRMKMIERFDTAGSAREIAENRLEGHAAICSELAASIYGLDILETGIETNKRNFTRFLIVAHPDNTDALPDGDAVDKSSIVFTLPHNRGALSKVLTILAFYDLNLTKLQSFPIIGREWEYKFYVDLSFDDYNRYRQALDAARPLTSAFKILGEYVSCRNIV